MRKKKFLHNEYTRSQWRKRRRKERARRYAAGERWLKVGEKWKLMKPRGEKEEVPKCQRR